MQAILDFIVFFFFSFSLWSLSTQSQFLLANTTPILHPNSLGGNKSDYEALLAIKAEISNDPNSFLTSWNNNSSLHFCRWEGVTCGRRHRRVVSLDLHYNNLVGTLSPFIGNLSFLHELNLEKNSFRGDIPHQISHLSRLQILALGANSFGGEIPSNLSRCLHLNILSLHNNNLDGRIPPDLASLPNLAYLALDNNNISGRLEDINNISTSLRTLTLAQNHLQGSIPNDIGRLKGLEFLVLDNNLLSGAIPASLFNLSSLRTLSLSGNQIQGHLPQDFGLRFPQLRGLYLRGTALTGSLPNTLSNLSELVTFELSANSFTGRFTLNGNHLPRLTQVNIDSAFSLGGEVRDLEFLDTLTNCTNLTHLLIGGNAFTGSFPQSILNLSTKLRVLNLGDNQIVGQLPFGLGKFVNLIALLLDYNHFTGPIPVDIGKLESIGLLSLSNNKISGEIPSFLGNLTLLNLLSMEYNNLEGPLPKSLGNCKNLQEMSLSYNNLSGILPVELFGALSLVYLVIGRNNLQGSFPVEISRLKTLVLLDASQNRFSGEIPSTLGGCTSLSTLDMSQNSFIGSIPESLSSLKSIQYLNLSCNNLSGHIPSYFSTWPYLLSLNLSFNMLEGEVPISRVFANTSVVSVVGNSKLCGGVIQLHLPKCPTHIESKKRRLSLAMILIISIICALIIILSVAVCFYFLCTSNRSKDASSGSLNIKPLFEVSYQMLSRATGGFSPSNLIGAGGFGSVYKGILHQDDKELVFAIKVMNLQNERADKSFMIECNALRNIRHRNLVKIITVCSSIDAQRNDFKALVYEFMPRGSLESWLHSSTLVTNEHNDGSLSLFQRLSIALDVASALEYLHIGCATPIIHCDLKPSNILLDEEMTAHVGDFGLAKFISGASTSSTVNHTSSTQVRGTVGYAAPEYGLGSKVSPEGDIYSFGIVVLEMMTSKKPTDPMFNNGLNLHEFAKSALPGRIMEIIDQRMLGETILLPARTGADIKKMEGIKSLIMIGVQCSMELPQERMSINDVVNNLKSSRHNLLSTRT